MKKRFALAVIVITAIALSLVGCGVKVTNISAQGWEWGGPVISTPTDNGCPPEEHEVGWC